MKSLALVKSSLSPHLLSELGSLKRHTENVYRHREFNTKTYFKS